MQGISPPLWTPTVHASEILAPFVLYTPIIVQSPNLVPINAPFVLYTPIVVQTPNLVPIDAPFTLYR